jgi:hypothetical protein
VKAILLIIFDWRFENVGLIFVLVEEDWVELVVGGQLFEGVAFARS